MTAVTIDWSNGPRPCSRCDRPMRPRGKKADGRWRGTIQHQGHGLCPNCSTHRVREDEAVAAATGTTTLTKVKGRAGTYVWAYPLAQGIPLAHLDLEARADLADLLRREHLLLTGIQRREVLHQPGGALLVLTLTVTPATRPQMRALQGDTK